MNNKKSFFLVRIAFFAYVFLVLNLAYGQEQYLTADEIEYSSALEKRVLNQLLAQNDESDILDGFLVTSDEDSIRFEGWRAMYNREMNTLKDRKRAKKLDKDVKYIYDQLHAKFLTKYIHLAYFDQLFESGIYNCVTAVALYAMAFEEFGIPYHIKETPTHVYIVADPDNTQLLIETTDPIDGFKTFSNGFKEQFVIQLGQMKLVNEKDMASKGMYGVFDEFYFGGAELTLLQLVGIQYYNKGVALYNEKKYHEAWAELTKAQLFHTNEQISQILLASLANVVSFSDYSDMRDIELLPYLERFLEFDLKETNVVYEFERMINYVLVQNNNTEWAEKAYAHFMDKSKNENLKKEITYIYYNQAAIRSYNRGNYIKAYKSITKAYTAKPGNINLESMLLESFRMGFRNKSSDVALAALDTLIIENPKIVENQRINSMRLNLYLEVMKDNFEEKKPTAGNQLKDLFEKAVEANPDYRFDEQMVGNAYSKAAVYYFKKGYTTKAKGIIRTGLKYAPGNYELKSRLRMVSY